jgi:tagatose-6-phosphate ketose/aldose isomerase
MSDLDRHATWREIHAQPSIWAEWAHALPVADLRDWVVEQVVDEVWFCGAGSSAYLGDILCAHLPPGRFRAVPTTDLVSRPAHYLTTRRPLIVSFGRSGNSTESIGTIEALDALAPYAPRLHITCNADSALAQRAHPGRVVVLPPATHDAGFAMTSSFTTMLVTALAIFDETVPVAQVFAVLETLSGQLARLLPRFADAARASRTPQRAVFLGTGPLAFAAREASLKVMELAAGQIPALWDSSLGFRHGPKSFVLAGTDIWLFLSRDPQARRYEDDLLAELRQQFSGSHVIAVGEGGDIDLPAGTWSMILPVVLAQILAVTWSDRLGLNVDNPFAGLGTLSRVVSGVRLYPPVSS